MITKSRTVSVLSLGGLFFLGSAGVLFVLPSFALRFIFGLGVVFILIWIVRNARRLDLNTLALITAYTLAVAQFGLHFYFRLPGWLMVIIAFIWTSLLFWLGFSFQSGKVTSSAKIMSLAAGFAASEIVLALLFLPIQFWATGTIFFLLFYLAWMVSYFYFSSLLNRHRIIIHVIFASVFLLLVLFTAQWKFL